MISLFTLVRIELGLLWWLFLMCIKRFLKILISCILNGNPNLQLLLQQFKDIKMDTKTNKPCTPLVITLFHELFNNDEIFICSRRKECKISIENLIHFNFYIGNYIINFI